MALINHSEVDFKQKKDAGSDVVASKSVTSKKRRLFIPELNDENDYVFESASEDDRSARVSMTASKILMPALRSVLNENKELWGKDLEDKAHIEAVILPCSKSCMSTLSQVNNLRKELEIRGLDVVNVKDQWPLRRLIQYVSLLNEKQQDKYNETSYELTLAVFKPIFDAYNSEDIKPVIHRFGEYKVKYDNDLMLLNKILGSTTEISCRVEDYDWITNRGHCITDLVANLVKVSAENIKKHTIKRLSKDVQRQLICRTITDVQSLQMESYEYEKFKATDIANELPVFPANDLTESLIKYTELFRGVQSKLVDLVYSILAKGSEYVMNVEENVEWSRRMNFIDVFFPIIETVVVDKNLTIEDKEIAVQKSIALSNELYEDVLKATKLENVDSSTSKQLLSLTVKILCGTVRSNVSTLETPAVYINYVSALAQNETIQNTINDISEERGVSKENISSTLIKSMFPLMSEVSKFNYFESNRPAVICAYAELALKHLKDGRVLSQLSNNVADHAQDDIGIIEKELSTVFGYYCVVRKKAFYETKSKLELENQKGRVDFVQKLEASAKEANESGGETKAIKLIELSERFFISRLPVFSSAVRQFASQLSNELDVELAFMNKKTQGKGMP